MKKIFIFCIFSFCALSEVQTSENKNLLDLRNKTKHLFEKTDFYSTPLTANHYLRCGTYVMAGIGISRMFTNKLSSSILFGSLVGGYFAHKHKILETNLEKERNKLFSYYSKYPIDEYSLNSHYFSFSKTLLTESTNNNLFEGRSLVTTDQLNQFKNNNQENLMPNFESNSIKEQANYDKKQNIIEMHINATLFAVTTILTARFW